MSYAIAIDRGMFRANGSNPVRLHRGLGDAGTTAFTLGSPLATGGAVLGGAALSSAGITAASLATAGITAGVGLVIAAIALWLGRRGPKQKVATTQIVNEAAPLLQQNLDAWNACPKGCADQSAALNAALQVWYAVVNACCNTSLGDPGHSCMDDRLPAGVAFQCQPGAFHVVGNGMYDWFFYYILPILNDPQAAGCCPPQIYYDPAGQSPVAMPACAPNTASAGGAAAAIAALTGAGSIAGIPLEGWILIATALGLLLWSVS